MQFRGLTKTDGRERRVAKESQRDDDDDDGLPQVMQEWTARNW